MELPFLVTPEKERNQQSIEKNCLKCLKNKDLKRIENQWKFLACSKLPLSLIKITHISNANVALFNVLFYYHHHFLNLLPILVLEWMVNSS